MRAACLAPWLLLVAFGCGDDDDGDEPEPEPPRAPAPRELFPLTAGDRWRIESGSAGTPQNTGVTGVDDEGVAVVHGTAHAVAERYRATEDAVSLVDPAGRVLVPVLRAPLRTGSRWEYTMSEDGPEIACTAEVRDTAASEQVGGLAVDGCVELRRECRHPEGAPFPAATIHTADEVYCPSLGRVVVRHRFRPPPPSEVVPGDRTTRVVGYRVAGAPRWPAPETFDCRSFILLPSDVQAACGTSIRPVEPVAGRSGNGRCTYRYASPEGDVEVSSERVDEPPSAEALDAALELPADVQAQTHEGARVATTGDEVRFALAQGRVVVQGRAARSACPEESVMRLIPLLRSLLR